VKHVVVTNLGFPDFTIEPPLELEGIGFSILAAAGIAMTIDRQGWRTLQHPVHGPLMIPPAIASAILLLPTTPAVYSYTWLPVVASLSVYAGLALVAAFHRLRSGLTVANGVIALLVASATIVPAWVIGVRLVPRNLANDADLARMRRELAYACPGEAVLDGGPLVVFRPGALRYPSLVEGVRTWIIRGIIPAEPLLEDLRRAQAPVGLFDYRIQDLKGAIGAFIASHYVPEPDKLLVAGRSLTLSAEAGEVEVELLKSGRYRLSASAGVRATIDGVAPPAAVATPGAGAQAPVASVWLDAGAHRFSWIGGPGTLRIVIAPCAERRSRGADAA
jgi:hypothetical protein